MIENLSAAIIMVISFAFITYLFTFRNKLSHLYEQCVIPKIINTRTLIAILERENYLFN